MDTVRTAAPILMICAVCSGAVALIVAVSLSILWRNR